MKFSTSSVFHQHQVFLHRAKAVILYVVLLCTLFCLTPCGTCLSNEMQCPLECDTCELYCCNDTAGLEDLFFSDASAVCNFHNSLMDTSRDGVCHDSCTLCLPSTFSTFSSNKHGIKEAGFKSSLSCSNDASYDSMFKLTDGRRFSCSLDLKDEMQDPSVIQPSSCFKNVISSYVEPHGTTSVGSIFFHPLKKCLKGLVPTWNNFTGVKWVTLRGFKGSLSPVFPEETEPVESLEFKFEHPISVKVSPTEILNQMQDTASSWQLSKEVYSKKSGYLPFDVRKIEVSGKDGHLDGFFVHSCKSFSLEPGESTQLLISYKTDFSGTTVLRDLELSVATGIFVIPMKKSLPLYVVNIHNGSIFWMKVRKFSLVVLFAASLTFMVFGGMFPHVMAWSSHDHPYKSENSFGAGIRTSGNYSCAHPNQINDNSYTKIDGFITQVVKDKSSFLSSPDDDSVDYLNAIPDFAMSSHRSNARGEENILLNENIETLVPCSLLQESVTVEDSNLLDASQPGNLTVRVGKDKRRRRRRRKGAGAGLTSLLDVSSSQSGNSTPSSPLSPFTSLTPNRVSMCSADVDQPIKARDPFGQVTLQRYDKPKDPEANYKATKVEHEVSMKDSNNSWSISVNKDPAVLRKIATKPVLFPSATFPCTKNRGSTLMRPSNNCFPPSSIPLYSRAPGPKLYNQIHVPSKEKMEDGNTYDIWADHLSGLTSMATNMSRKTESSSGSLFVRGPVTFKEKSQLESELKATSTLMVIFMFIGLSIAGRAVEGLHIVGLKGT